jgi:hypothetical protein
MSASGGAAGQSKRQRELSDAELSADKRMREEEEGKRKFLKRF